MEAGAEILAIEGMRIDQVFDFASGSLYL